MKIEMPDEVAEGIGSLLRGLGYCLVFLGIGGCLYLADRKPESPAVEIKESFNQKPK